MFNFSRYVNLTSYGSYLINDHAPYHGVTAQKRLTHVTEKKIFNQSIEMEFTECAIYNANERFL